MTESDSDPIKRQVSIEDRRVAEIFDTRERAQELLTMTEMAKTRPGKGHIERLKAGHGAVKSYIIISEDVIRDGSEQATYYWNQHPFGVIRFDSSEEAPVLRIQGLKDILDVDPVITHQWEEPGTGFMKGQTAQRQETKYLPLNVLWEAYRVTTALLSDRGFELEVDQPPGHIGPESV